MPVATLYQIARLMDLDPSVVSDRLRSEHINLDDFESIYHMVEAWRWMPVEGGNGIRTLYKPDVKGPNITNPYKHLPEIRETRLSLAMGDSPTDDFVYSDGDGGA